MKKILLIIGLLLLIFIGCVYLLIPSKLNVSVVTEMHAPANAIYRCISRDDIWNKWLKQSADSISKKITASSPFANAAYITLFYKNDSTKTTMNILHLTNDSVAVRWDFEMVAGANPFTRISKYNRAKNLKNKMDEILSELKAFASKEENIYGFKIQEASIKDTFLISAKTQLTYYPQTDDLYNLIDKLKNYVQQSNAQVTGYPMYNVSKINRDTLRLMVAIPVNKMLQETNAIAPVHMVPGKFLTGEVTGGNKTVTNALEQMLLYFPEHNRTAMAIPFCYLITDRRQQPDTTKWVTKIYAPVF